MSDSVDRVFVHALATVRRLPRTGSSRPPPEARLRLYGLYKQSMEGDVEAILPRPTLPPSSPDPSSNTVHRYASRDLRNREAQAEIEKWDAWHACAGMSRTEAKRRYISTLIDTMKEYASGTQESRELIAELEFVWSQIRSQSSSSEEDNDSPTRRLERAGMKPTSSFSTIPPGQSPGPFGRSRDPNQMRVLSPVSQKGSDDIVEAEEVNREDTAQDDAQPPEQPSGTQPGISDPQWRQRIEAHLRHLSIEIAALREQLSSNNLLSHSTYSAGIGPSTLRKRIIYRSIAWVKWLTWTTLRQLSINAAIIILLLAWGRWRNDRRVEAWLRRRWNDFRSIFQSWLSSSSSLQSGLNWPRPLKPS